MLSIVYVHVGTEKTEYLNMLRISVASVRKHMKTIRIVILSDNETGDYLRCCGYFSDEHLTVQPTDVPEGYDLVEKSRYLKTHLRELVSGDVLYIDSDTILCKDISDVIPKSSVSMVLDEHCLLDEQDDKGASIKNSAAQRGIDLCACTRYFNSGVIMAKDDETARLFFKNWFELWDKTRKPGMHHDQFSLNDVNAQMNVVEELDGAWNCQITATYRAFCYLKDVVVLHYLSLQPNGVYRLNHKELLAQAAENCQDVIDHPERQFLPFHMLADESEEYRIMQQSQFHLTYRMYTGHPKFYRFTEKLLSVFRK